MKRSKRNKVASSGLLKAWWVADIKRLEEILTKHSKTELFEDWAKYTKAELNTYWHTLFVECGKLPMFSPYGQEIKRK